VKNRLYFAIAALAAVPVAVLAQEVPAAPANPISASEKGVYGFVSGVVVGAAEKMPEENYAFKPTPEVRSFGQLVGHVADAQYMFCSLAIGDPSSMKDIERCGRLLRQSPCQHDRCPGQSNGEIYELSGGKTHRPFVLSLNTAHTDEHYGNMVTYLRLKGIVPPSSEKQSAPASK